MIYSLRPYQQDLYKKIVKSLDAGQKTVLAAAPSSGKTLIASQVIEKYVKDGKRVLVLAHGTTVLRTQFHQAFISYKPKLKEQTVLVPHAPAKNKSVLIGIPQGLKNNVSTLGKIDLVVVDEAHEFYLTPTVQNILKKLKPKNTLLLTGTPSNFVAANKVLAQPFNIIVLPLISVPPENLADAKIRILPIDGKIELKDFNQKNDVNNKFKNDHKSEFVEECLKEVSKAMFPLLIASRDVEQAHIVRKILAKKGYKVGLSTAEDDLESARISEFKNGKIEVLVVVRRGVLGFDMPEMKTVIDLTLSRNINRMYQLFARVLRKSEKNIKKEYIKVSPKSILVSYKFAVECMNHLCHPDWISLYDGKSLSQLKMIRGPSESTGNGGGRKFISLDNDPNDGLEIWFSSLRADLRNGSLETSVSQIRNSLMGTREFWTFESCMMDAKNYKNRKEWLEKSSSTFYKAQREGWLDECCKHMKVMMKHTKESCMKDAKNYKTRREWEVNSRNSFAAAYRNEWLDECCAHMNYVYKYHTKESCMEDAQKYSTRTEWKRNSKNIWEAAERGGWLKECYAHMMILHKTRTKESCMMDAKNYKNRKEWLEKSSSTFYKAQREGWLDECAAQMENNGYARKRAA